MEYLEPKDLAKLFKSAHHMNRTHHMILLTQFFCGARVSEILQLKGEDIFEHGGRLVIKIHAAKGGVDRIHNLHFDVRPEFDMSPLMELASRRRNSLLFGGTYRQYLNKRMKDFCLDAGIHSDFGHSHVMRHSAAMVIWIQTQRPGAITHFLGHRSPSTALVYLAENDGKMAQAAMDSV